MAKCIFGKMNEREEECVSRARESLDVVLDGECVETKWRHIRPHFFDNESTGSTCNQQLKNK